MSVTSLPRRPRSFGSRRSIAIVASLYNDELVAPLIESTIAELKQLDPTLGVSIYRVPGAFEIPVCTNQILSQTNPACVIALGVIIRGQTAHADLIGKSVTDALQNIALAQRTPVIHEVLLVADEEQAADRCTGDKNRGTEAAKAAVTMIDLFAKLKTAAEDALPNKSARANG